MKRLFVGMPVMVVGSSSVAWFVGHLEPVHIRICADDTTTEVGKWEVPTS